MDSAEAMMARFLARLSLRSELDPADQQAILGLPGLAERYAANQDIIMPGEHVTRATLVVSGIVARFDQREDGQRQLTAIHIAGDMCDLHSTVLPVASWGIAALTETVVLRVPHVEIFRVAGEHRAVAAAFWRDTTVDAGIFAKWVANIGRKDSRARLAHLLCELGTRMELAGLGPRTAFPFAMTQSQLADALGLTAVHVNRTIQGLRADGLIEIGGGRVMIPDWAALAREGEFDPAYLQASRHPSPDHAFPELT